jgi:hypothetical protein
MLCEDHEPQKASKACLKVALFLPYEGHPLCAAVQFGMSRTALV